jgi:hypothetical protein
LCHCIQTTFSNVPGGVLVFFPSFSVLEELSVKMKSENRSGKRIIAESRGHNALKEFRTVPDDERVALLAVCRGKMSEGINFSDDYARCVSVVGIPFPNTRDFKVELHREWLEKKRKGSGSRWYTEVAMRAVNQAIGRAIRHKNDYAVCILYDERYKGFGNMLSKWIRPSVKFNLTWPEIEREIRSFFEEKESVFQCAQVANNPPDEPVREEEVRPVAPNGGGKAYYEEEDPYDYNFTISQKAIFNPKMSKAQVAACKLHIKMGREERDEIVKALRMFKKSKDCGYLTDLLHRECGDIIRDAMNPKLRDRLK